MGSAAKFGRERPECVWVRATRVTVAPAPAKRWARASPIPAMPRDQYSFPCSCIFRAYAAPVAWAVIRKSRARRWSDVSGRLNAEPEFDDVAIDGRPNQLGGRMVT